MLQSRVVVVCATVLLSVVLFGCGSDDGGKDSNRKGNDELLGTWIGHSGEILHRLTFGQKGVVKFQDDSDRFGRGGFYKMYSVDWSKRPAHLDTYFGSPESRSKEILQLTDKDVLLIEQGHGRDRERPTKFTEKAMEFSREKGATAVSEMDESQEAAVLAFLKLGASVRISREGSLELHFFPFTEIDFVRITDAELIHLKGLPNLGSVDLGFQPKITNKGLEHLEPLSKLRSLDLSFTKISDEGLVHIKELTNLTTLLLRRTPVSDSGLEHLKGLTSLEELNLQDTKVTEEGVRKLQEALPNCKILHDSLPKN